MTLKQIEEAREIRLWITQVIVPTGIAAVVLMSNPEIRHFVKDQTNKVKCKIKSKFKK